MDKIVTAKGMFIVLYGPGSELDRDRDLDKKENEYFKNLLFSFQNV